MKNISYTITLLILCLIVVSSCTSTNVGEDTDGPTKKGYPEVTTSTVVVATSTGVSAVSGGEVISQGDSKIINRGVCWSLNPNPSIADSHTKDGAGTGLFTSDINGLTENTKYYLRAYATNNSGTSYGGEVDFYTSKILRANVVLSSQDEVDAFGAQNYLIVNGDVFIGKKEGSDITNLRALNVLNQIRGNLTIGKRLYPNPRLKNLDGLENLAWVMNSFFPPFELRIGYNESLENIDGLKGLGYFDGDLTIENNISLKNINGLARITEVEDITIRANDNLVSLDGLENLKKFKGGIRITDNELLVDINGLKNLPKILDFIDIYRNENLSDLSALSNVTHLRYSLALLECPKITSLEHLENLTTIGGHLGLIGLGITNLDGLSKLSDLGSEVTETSNGFGFYNIKTLSIRENNELIDYCGLKTLFQEGYGKQIEIKNNIYNPSKDDILGDNCTQ
jgi:hypothetical protein